MKDSNSPKHSPLEAAHIASGARMIEFGGWLMPLQYKGIIEEHSAVRSSSGMFDISHMGEVTVGGPGALEWLETLLTNRVGKLPVGRGQYTLMLDQLGGVIDDLIIYRTDESVYFLVINAACREVDLNWMRSLLPDDGSVVLTDEGDAYAAISIQGPHSAELLQLLFPGFVLPGRNGIAPIPNISSRGKDVTPFLARTGYTGEDGFELFIPALEGLPLWERLVQLGVKPCGLGARDTLRLEMGYPLNGSDLSRSRSPLEAGLGRFVALDDNQKGNFSGRKFLESQRSAGLPSLLTPLRLSIPGPPLRPHYPVIFDHSVVGETSSGALSPSLGESIAMAYLPPAISNPGTTVEIEVRGKRYPATVCSLPFYKKP